jgi:pyruvate dehydrogenase E2 component (dihydrolipoamide acetyltransferase)
MSTEICVPDLGGASDVEVIEVLMKEGDTLELEQDIIVLESDKATMEVPSSAAGLVESISVKVGDKLAEGDVIAIVASSVSAVVEAPKPIDKPVEALPSAKEVKVDEAPVASPALEKQVVPPPIVSTPGVSDAVHAGPAVRRLARELGVALSHVSGSGHKSRVTKADLHTFIKKSLAQGGGGGLGLPVMPAVDFSQFGEVESQPLSRIKKLTAKNLARNSLLAPQVTQFDEVDITDMESFRQEQKEIAQKQGFKLTPLVFIMKALAKALEVFPAFNSSLDVTCEHLILKKYFHLGVAVDTPNGLVVPVVRDVNKKSLFELAKELGEMSLRARDGKLSPKEMQGGSMTISSLGGISGTAFTPIVNLPEVAILGVSKSSIKPVFQKGEFVPRLILPLSLTYDHRVIDGAEAARFTKYLTSLMSDIRQLLI